MPAPTPLSEEKLKIKIEHIINQYNTDDLHLTFFGRKNKKKEKSS